MRKLYLFVFCLSLSVSTTLSAQTAFVLDSSSHRIHANTVNVYSIALNDFQLQLAPNFVLDLATPLQISTADQPAFDNSFFKSTDNNFPNSVYYPNSFNYMTTSRGYLADIYMHQTASGFYEYAMNKTTTDNTSLEALGGAATDSLIMPAQIISYSSPRTIVPYPATMGSAWKSNFRLVANARVTISSAGLKNVPLTVVNNWTYRDSIIAWGNVIMPVKGGKASKPYPVLISKRWSTRKDSMYLNGVPAPTQLMSAFGAVQGNTVNTYRYIAIRLDEPNYLFNLSYGSDASYSLNPTIFLSDLVQTATGVEDEIWAAKASVNPNPASNEAFLNFHKQNDAPWTLELYTMMGQQIQSHMLSASAGDVQLPLAVVDLASGSYTAVVRDEHQQVVLSKSFVVTH